eukprot:SAG22_NODE_114_length_19318_cov_13.809980_7_plen_178_part_00
MSMKLQLAAALALALQLPLLHQCGAELDILVSDGWPAGWLTLPSGAAVGNRLMTANLSEAAVARGRFNATVFFGSLPDNHAGPGAGVFDRSHPKNTDNLNGLFPRWRQNLDSFIRPALPMIADGRIAGIFVGDEVACSDVSFFNYSLVLTRLRSLVGPKAKIWANECGHPSGWPIGR